MKWIGKNSLSDTSLSDITSVIAGTGLTGGGTSGDVTLTVADPLNQDTSGTAANANLAAQATILATARAINGVDFNGSAPITVTANAETLTGNELKSTVTGSALTSVGIIGSGEWRGTAISATYLDGQSGTNTGDQTSVSGNAGTATVLATARAINGVDFDGSAPITIRAAAGTVTGTELNSNVVTSSLTSVGTIGTGVWQGTAISGVYITTATASAKGVVELATTAETTTGTDADRVVTPDGLKDGYQGSANVSTVGTITTGTWRGTAIEHESIEADAIDGDNIADDSINSEHYVDGSIDTAHIADDQVTFAKALGVTPNIFDNKIKLIPSDFMANDDGGNQKFGVGYKETAGSGYGMRVANNDTELYAFVSIPQGMTATHVDIFDKNDLAIEVFEAQINATTMVSKGSGNANTTLDITDVASTATNFLVIEVVTTSATNDKVYGGTVTIA